MKQILIQKGQIYVEEVPLLFVNAGTHDAEIVSILGNLVVPMHDRFDSAEPITLTLKVIAT